MPWIQGNDPNPSIQGNGEISFQGAITAPLRSHELVGPNPSNLHTYPLESLEHDVRQQPTLPWISFVCREDLKAITQIARCFAFPGLAEIFSKFPRIPHNEPLKHKRKSRHLGKLRFKGVFVQTCLHRPHQGDTWMCIHNTYSTYTFCEHLYVYHVPIRIQVGRGTCHLGWWLKILGTIQVNSTVTLCLTVLDTSCWLKLTSLNVRIFGCVMPCHNVCHSPFLENSSYL